MADFRTRNELRTGPQPPEHARPPRTSELPPHNGDADTAGADCQKADWAGPTAELPVQPSPDPGTLDTGFPPGSDVRRLRRWGREYGGFIAAGTIAAAVLISSATLFSQTDQTWYAGGSAVVGTPSQSAPPAATTEPAPAPDTSGATGRVGARTATTAKPPATGTRSTAAAPRPSRASTPTPKAASAAPTLLGPDDGQGLWTMLSDYCRQRFQRDAGLTRRGLASGAVDNWVCRSRQGSQTTIDMTAACRFRYPGDVLAKYLDPNDPFSWRCYRR